MPSYSTYVGCIATVDLSGRFMATRARRFDGISRTVYRRFVRLPHSVTFIAASIREIAFRHTIVGRGVARLSLWWEWNDT